LLTPSTAIEARHKVLLVDDDAVSLELMAMLLAHEGHQVVSATGAEAALDVLATEKADVLLVDLQMPGISGGQLAEKVRAMDGPNPLLLAMSATEVQRRQLPAFDGFLLKPLALGDLRKAMNPTKSARNPKQRTKISASCEILDMTVVGKLLVMMPEQALHDVITACIADTRACIETIRIQRRQHDLTGVQQSAHRIKGAAAMIGASHLAKLAAGLELGGSKEAATPDVLDELSIACSELQRMLLAGKLKKTRAPHHESTDRNHSSHS
jgi:CheY-like chemotaxis protein